jgi:tripartite-type tricarboxylate transporter receptor subunit TctC
MTSSIRFAASILCLFAITASATAQTYPTKPIRIIVPFAPGGGSDIIARLLAADFTKAWGQQIIVDNRAGAGGIIGADLVAKSPPDGYTLMVVELVGLTIRSELIQTLPFDLVKDFAPVGVVAYGANVLVCHPSVPVKSTRDLIALAKARPGRLNFAVPGHASGAHLAGVELEQASGVKWTYVPYKGGGPAVQDLLGGQVDFGVQGLLASYPHIKSGRLRALAVATSARHPAMPEVPTIAETVPGHESGSRQSVLAPAATPRAIIEKWSAEITRLNNTATMKERLAAYGAVPLSVTPSEMQSYIANEKLRWGKVIKAAQIRPD